MSSRLARFRLLTVVFWILFGVISGIEIQISMLAHHHAWALVIGYQVLVWSVWIAYTFAIGSLIRWAQGYRARGARILLHVGVALGFAILHTALWVEVELWLKPYDFMNPTSFVRRFTSVTIPQLPLELLLYGLVVLAYHAAESAARERDRERRAAQLETSLAEAKLHALELRIQPHFLFNTLNAIGSLVRAGQSEQAIAMMGGLSDLLRYSLDRGGGSRVALEEEATMVERYLDIQRLRFADRLEVEIDVTADAARGAVPVLLLQPLAENAIQHGIATSHAPGSVRVRARRDGDDLEIELFNTGRLSPDARHRVGLSTTVSRLHHLYGDRGRFELIEREGGVLARVRLPWSPA